MLFTEEHNEIRRTVSSFIEKEVNPRVDQWEEEGIFPAHEVFGKAGELGLLGISKPVEYGGMGLDYSYNMVALEEWGLTHCGSIPMAVGVQTDMATPALARFGSDELRAQFLAPAIAGDMVCSIGVSEPHAGSDVAGRLHVFPRVADDPGCRVTLAVVIASCVPSGIDHAPALDEIVTPLDLNLSGEAKGVVPANERRDVALDRDAGFLCGTCSRVEKTVIAQPDKQQAKQGNKMTHLGAGYFDPVLFQTVGDQVVLDQTHCLQVIQNTT